MQERTKAALQPGQRYRHRYGAWWLCLEDLGDGVYLMQQEQGNNLLRIYNPVITDNGGLSWAYSVPA